MSEKRAFEGLAVDSGNHGWYLRVGAWETYFLGDMLHTHDGGSLEGKRVRITIEEIP